TSPLTGTQTGTNTCVTPTTSGPTDRIVWDEMGVRAGPGTGTFPGETRREQARSSSDRRRRRCARAEPERRRATHREGPWVDRRAGVDDRPPAVSIVAQDLRRPIGQRRAPRQHARPGHAHANDRLRAFRAEGVGHLLAGVQRHRADAAGAAV